MQIISSLKIPERIFLLNNTSGFFYILLGRIMMHLAYFKYVGQYKLNVF